MCRADVPGSDPVIELARGARAPFSQVLAERDMTDGRIVPEESVTEIRNGKGHTGLRIALRQFEQATFVVEKSMLIAAHPINLFVRFGFETHTQGVITTDLGCKCARMDH